MSLTYFVPANQNIQSEAVLKAVTAYMWELIRPLDVREIEDVTNELISIIKHPTDGRIGLVVDDTHYLYNFNVHPQTQDSNVDTKLGGLVTAGMLTVAERTALSSHIKDNKGNSINVKTLIPTKYKEYTQEEMEAEGWFPTLKNI